MNNWPALLELEGARIYVEVRGTGEPVLLLHGLALDQRSWDDQVGPLSERYRVVRIDLHGFGKSSAVHGPYSHPAILAALLERLGIERAHVVGHSMGGRIAAELVQSHPQAARSLTLVSSDIAGLPFKTLGPVFANIFETGRRDIGARKKARVCGRRSSAESGAPRRVQCDAARIFERGETMKPILILVFAALWGCQSKPHDQHSAAKLTAAIETAMADSRLALNGAGPRCFRTIARSLRA